jgi:hypothetical protein
MARAVEEQIAVPARAEPSTATYPMLVTRYFVFAILPIRWRVTTARVRTAGINAVATLLLLNFTRFASC